MKKGCGIILIFGCTYIYASSERVVHVFRGVKQTTIRAATGFDCNTNKIVEKANKKIKHNGLINVSMISQSCKMGRIKVIIAFIRSRMKKAKKNHIKKKRVRWQCHREYEEKENEQTKPLNKTKKRKGQKKFPHFMGLVKDTTERKQNKL